MKYLVFVVLILICHTKESPAQDVDRVRKIVDGTRLKLVPDNRLSIYNVDVRRAKGYTVLSGEIYGEEIYRDLMESLRDYPGEIRDSIELLPARKLGSETKGIITLSVANVRTQPKFSAEMATQALLGNFVNVLDKQGGWLRVQLPDGYIGWTNQASLERVAGNEFLSYKNKSRIIYTEPYGFSYEKPDPNSQTISDLVIGDCLFLEREDSNFFYVSYADGRSACVRKNEAMLLDEWSRSRSLIPENIVKTAYHFLGIPYLWGGTSSKGLDCSGFAKLVYFLNGFELPRDADQQGRMGDLVDVSGGMARLQPGDLLFFGDKEENGKKERIVHVAISLGNTEFIHASGKITVNSLNPSSPVYDEYNRSRFLRAKRIIKNQVP